MRGAAIGGLLAGAALAAFVAGKKTGLLDVVEQTVKTGGMSDREVLARTIWGEARGEGFDGMRAVAHVVKNRVEDGIAWNGFDWKSVCLKEWQFSTWLDHDPVHAANKQKMLNVGFEDSHYVIAWQIAGNVMAGGDDDLTNGADHYFNPGVVLPDWAADMTFVTRIGGHDFYKDAA